MTKCWRRLFIKSLTVVLLPPSMRCIVLGRQVRTRTKPCMWCLWQLVLPAGHARVTFTTADDQDSVRTRFLAGRGMRVAHMHAHMHKQWHSKATRMSVPHRHAPAAMWLARC